MTDKELVREVLENLPEYLVETVFVCTDWDYDNCVYTIMEEGEGAATAVRHTLTEPLAVEGLKLMREKLNWTPAHLENLKDPANWDATDVDLLVQYSLLKQVIYG